MKTNFKNNLKNLSICNDGFSVNLVDFWYKKQCSKSKEGFLCKNHKKPKPAFGRCSQQRAMTWPHYGSQLINNNVIGVLPKFKPLSCGSSLVQSNGFTVHY